MSFIKTSGSAIFLFSSLVFLLCSCAEMPRQTNQSVASGKKTVRLFSLSITIPQHWRLHVNDGSGEKTGRVGKREGIDRNQIELVARDKKAKVLISSKKIVAPPHSTRHQDLIRAYGRIGIKQILEKGGTQNGFIDNLTIAEQPAVQYIIEQGAKVEMISFVQYKDKLFIIKTTAPREELMAINELILNNVHFGSKPARLSDTMHPIDYKISPHIAGLHFGDLYSQQMDFKNNDGRAKNISEQIEKLEQMCFTTALLRSEGLKTIQDQVHLQAVMDSVRKLYGKNKTILPVARCYGLVLFLENKFDQSFALFNRIIKNYPDDLFAKLYLVMIRPYSSGETPILLEKALNDYPGNVLGRYLQVKMLLALGKRREGIDRLKKLLRKHPENVWLNYVLVRNTDGDNSIPQKRIKLTYSRILEEVPLFTGARFNLALFLFKRKQYDESLEHLNIILARYPDDTASHILKGLIYKIQNKYLSAKNQFEVALILEPWNFKALYNLGALCASKLNDTICARQAFIHYLYVAPQNDRNAAVTTWLHDN